MGKMGYSIDFGVVKTGKTDRMLHLIENFLTGIANIGQITWPIALAKKLDISAEQKEFEGLASRLAEDREKVSKAISNEVLPSASG
jgi:hypothetical protein